VINLEHRIKSGFTFPRMVRALAPTSNAGSSPAAGNLMQPNYQASIGSRTFSAQNGPELVRIKVVRSIGLPIDSCEIFLVGSGNYAFKKGDALKIKLGYENKLESVFSGIIDNIEYELSRVRVTALGLAVGLLRLRLNRVYQNQTAGKIVSNMAQEVRLKVKKASDGISLPVYVIDEGANAYEHILRLAERCNFDVYMTDDEQLVFKEWGGGKNNPLQFGKEITRVETFEFSPLYESTKIYGESPSSMKGSDTSHWLTKQEVKGEAGKGAVLSLQDPAIRDKKTAETVAKARMTKLEYVFGAVVETLGKPEIKLGDTVTLENIPSSQLKGQLEVRSVQHYLGKAEGFTTVVNCWMRGP
jgi:phage protein D